jgi:hypothetical protein
METANREHANSTTIFSLEPSTRPAKELVGALPNSAGQCPGAPPIEHRISATTPKGREDVLSQLLIQQYLNELSRLKKVSGTHRESVVREAFKDLLKAWGRTQDLTFVPEYQLETKTKDRRYADGALLLHTLRVPFGYWEAKDSNDDLDEEIQKKFRAGYPKTNIIFEDSTQAVLFHLDYARCLTRYWLAEA